MALRAGDASGSLTNADIFQAVQYACNNGADVVNGSFGGPGKSLWLGNLLKSESCRNTLFVFAAGNDSAVLTNNTAATNAYPCEYHRPAPHGFSVPNIICVAASTRADVLATFSNRGPAAVHLAAPGGNGSGTPSQEILSTWPEFDTIFADDLEAGFTSWTGGGGTGSWSRTTELSVSGLWSMTDSPGALYPNNADLTIRNAAAFDLSGRQDCSVDYALRVVIRDILGNQVFDWLSIEAATDPAGPWEELNFYAGGFSAFVTEDLAEYDGLSTVYLRFRLLSDNLFRDEGAHVDDVLVKCVIPNGKDYQAIPGTSMASPHVAGVAALLLDAQPGLTVAKLKNAILKGVDKKAAFANRVSTGGG
jgi:subtilisin family serine protease